MAKDTVSTGSSQKTKKSKDRKSDKKTDKKDKKKDVKKESKSVDPERQKVVTDDYRDGWSGIWKSKK